MAGRSFGRRWPAPWALGSLLLHGLLLGVAARRHPHELEVAPVVTPTRSEAELEVDLEVEATAITVGEASAASQASPPRQQARAGSALQRPAAESAVEVEVTAGDGPDDSAEASPSPPAGALDAAAPHLSLAQLGVDGANPFLDRGDPAAARAAQTARLQRRLDRSLAQGLANAEVAKGRGAGGPVMRSLEAAVYASNVPLEASASFVFEIDSEGKIVSSLVENDGTDHQAWSRVARETAQALAQRRLTVPKGRGVRLTVAVTSRLELPSGASPGVEVNVQGVPIKKGRGPRSTKLDIFIFPIPTVALGGDPADIGARARRMVRSHVVSEEVL